MSPSTDRAHVSRRLFTQEDTLIALTTHSAHTLVTRCHDA
jgi:hypothetical protein